VNTNDEECHCFDLRRLCCGGADPRSYAFGRHHVLTKLIRHGYYQLPDFSALRDIYSDLRYRLNHDAASIPYDTLLIERFGELVSAPADMRNTQFIAADRSAIAYPNGYEPDILTMMDILLADDDTFMDVGANWGYLTLHALMRQGYSGRVIAIEAAEGPRLDLKRLITACKFEDRVDIIAFAVGDHTGPVRMSDPVWSGMASVVNTGPGKLVYCRPLDELNLPRAKLIKVDIEGSEGAFLRGARGYFDKYEPSVIFECRMDTPGGEWMTPYNLLEERGYQCFAILFDNTSVGLGTFRATLRPTNPATRADLPEHLNILAIKNIDQVVEATRPNASNS
jgi:FkbM family methyltransferase